MTEKHDIPTTIYPKSFVDMQFPLSGADIQRIVSKSLYTTVPRPSSRPYNHGELYLRAGFDLSCEEDRPEAVVVLGMFDGCHLGHQELLAHARAHASKLELPLLIATFDPDPHKVLANQDGISLMDRTSRILALLSEAADMVYVIEFNKELAAQTAEYFCDQVLAEVVRPRIFYMGADARLGAGGKTDASAMASLGKARSFEVVPQQLRKSGQLVISSSEIRTRLLQGKVSSAAELLGHAYSISGLVHHGRGEGRSMGIATANIECNDAQLFPKKGVYAGYAQIDGQVFSAAINVGEPAMFGSGQPRLIEAHILDYEAELYGKELKLCFVAWLRAMHVFNSVDDLITEIKSNIDWVRNNLGSGSIRL